MPAWPWWSTRSQVERVDLYTRQSLFGLLWLFNGLLALSALVPAGADAQGLAAAVLGYGLVLTAAATRLLRDAADLHPAASPLPRRSLVAVLGLSAGGCVLALPLAPDLRDAALALVFTAVTWSVGALRDRRVLVLLMLACAVLPPLLTGHWWLGPYGLLAGAFVVASVRTSLWLYEVVAELDRARGAQAALAVAEERLRFSRDVHDVVGRRLSTIAVGAELAASLAERGDGRAAAQMLEVRAVAHQALREARELARGYRPTDLAQELEGARSLLRSAGIAGETRVDGLPPAWHEAAGWVVREAVTNVLRHSRATTVRVCWLPPLLRIENDGVPDEEDDGRGTGIAGLRERLLPLGARLDVERAPGRFTLVAALPGDGPRTVGTGAGFRAGQGSR